MSDLFEIELNIVTPYKTLERLGVCENGKAQKYFTSELMRLSADYIPFRDGMLEASGRMTRKGDAIEYHSPYARLHWYGKMMIDPGINAAGFFIPNVGWRSRRYVKKVVSDRKMDYQGAPRRGPFWVERTYMANMYSITRSTEKFIEENSK